MDLIKIENEQALLDMHAIDDIAFFESQIKQMKEKEDKLKKAILAEMEQKGVIKLDTDLFTINYIASTDRETLNSKKLREELPDIYDEYIEIKQVKPSIRIKLKEA